MLLCWFVGLFSGFGEVWLLCGCGLVLLAGFGFVVVWCLLVGVGCWSCGSVCWWLFWIWFTLMVVSEWGVGF